MLLPAAIITYPITHLLMHQQFLAAGASSTHLGYFASATSMFKSGMTLTKVKALFLSEERDLKRQKHMDGKNP